MTDEQVRELVEAKSSAAYYRAVVESIRALGPNFGAAFKVAESALFKSDLVNKGMNK